MSEMVFFTKRGSITEESRRAATELLAEAAASPEKTSKASTKGNLYRNTKTGQRPDLGEDVFRSGWEANFARVLRLYNIPYEYEPNTFEFPLQQRTRTYTPDFWLPETEELIELKGYMDAKSMTKLKRFRKYYEDDFKSLHLIVSKYNKTSKEFCKKFDLQHTFYEEISSAYKSMIAGWEGK